MLYDGKKSQAMFDICLWAKSCAPSFMCADARSCWFQRSTKVVETSICHRKPTHPLGVDGASSVTTFRSSVCTESIDEHCGAVTGIDADIAKAMSTVSNPRPASEHTYPYLLLVRSETVFGGCLHTVASRSSVMDPAGSRWLGRLHLPSAPTPWPVARSWVT